MCAKRLCDPKKMQVSVTEAFEGSISYSNRYKVFGIKNVKYIL